MNIKQQYNTSNFRLLVKASYIIMRTNFSIFPYLSSVVVVLCILEGLTYPGFLNKYFVIGLLNIGIIYIICGYLAGLTYSSSRKLSKIDLSDGQFGLLRKMYSLFLPSIVILMIIFNLSLPKLGNSFLLRDNLLLFPARFYLGIAAMLYFLIIYHFMERGTFRKPPPDVMGRREDVVYGLKGIVVILFIALFVWILYLDFRSNVPSIIYNFRTISSGKVYTYDQKMEAQIGPVYDYYRFINNNTPKDALIMHPKQQGQWPDVSNEGFTRYFLYPRNLISEDEPSLDLSRVDYIMLIGDQKLSDRNTQNSWPDFDVKAKKIVLYPFSKDKPPIVVYSDYHYDNFKYKHYWGIIEVDKESLR